MNRRRWWPWAVLLLAAAFPLVVNDPFLHRLAAVAAVQAILAVSLNLVLGYGGLISLGHLGFYAIGAYVAALLALKLGLPFAITLLAGGGTAAAVAWLLARPILRLRGHYFAMAMVAFAEVVRLVAYNWDSVTRGASGLPGIPRPSLLGWTAVSNRDNYYLALVLLVLAVVGVQHFVRSPLGVSLIASRDDDRAASSVGIGVAAVRTRALALAAFMAGAAGAFYAQYTTFVSVEPFLFNHMIEVLAMVAIGGMATMSGPIVGAVLLTLLPEALRDLAAFRMVLYGILLIIVIGLRPQGLVAGWSLRSTLSLPWSRSARGRRASA
ncbi:MAG: branched-chain amino acid ABC transporter permease [Chloroflexota bacterium]|nr:branched-chain amino acid ABC transporter permease [Chloroflexota bacterium]